MSQMNFDEVRPFILPLQPLQLCAKLQLGE